jgi:hypothetical protein
MQHFGALIGGLGGCGELRPMSAIEQGKDPHRSVKQLHFLLTPVFVSRKYQWQLVPGSVSHCSKSCLSAADGEGHYSLVKNVGAGRSSVIELIPANNVDN